MQTRNPLRRAMRVAAPFLVSMILISLWTVVGAQVSASVAQTVVADVTGQLSDNQLTSGDLGVAPNFVSATTVVRTPGGELAGPEGVQAFIESLQLDYPDAQFAVTEFQNVGNLIIVDWQGTVDGVVAIPGRTLIVVQDGVIEQLSFLNLNNVSPVEGGPRFTPSDSGRAAVVDFPVLTGSGYEGHVAEAELNQAWSDLDPNAIAERRAAPQASSALIDQETGLGRVIVDEVGNPFVPERAAASSGESATEASIVVDPAHPCIPCDIS